MSGNTKQLRNRMKSVDSTLHLTKAMGLVASSKLRRAMEGMLKGREYEKAVTSAVEVLLTAPECRKSPYLRKSEGDKVALVVIAGDRGLAGGYNANIFRTLKTVDATVIPVGKRVCDRFKAETLRAETFSYADAMAIATRLCRDFAEGRLDRVGILCTRYRSMMLQEAEIRYILPLEAKERTSSVGTVFEPDELSVLNEILPEYVAGMLVSAVRESFLCEVAARRTAMDSAGKNAQQMIDDLQLAYNRARQSAITQEITEIVAGSGS